MNNCLDFSYLCEAIAFGKRGLVIISVLSWCKNACIQIYNYAWQTAY